MGATSKLLSTSCLHETRVQAIKLGFYCQTLSFIGLKGNAGHYKLKPSTYQEPRKW